MGNQAEKKTVLFPVGRVKKVQELIDEFGLKRAVNDPTLRRNIAYTFQFTNVLEWLLEETDLILTAREQVIKFGIIALNSVQEGLIRDYLESPTKMKSSKKMGRNIEKLEKKEPISVPGDITNQLRMAHKKREKVHLHLCGGELEYKKYKIEDYYRVRDVVLKFTEWIIKHGKNTR